MSKFKTLCYMSAILVLLGTGALWADGGVTFDNIAADGGAGIDYARVPSARNALRQQLIDESPLDSSIFFTVTRPFRSPQKGSGSPGVAILDFDNDGDLDVFVTNGPGAPNSLFANQLVDSGTLSFVDVGAAVGVGSNASDASGVCFGDIDNDGDHDIYVLSTGEANHLFRNNLSESGTATFTDITATAGVVGNNRHGVGCTMADFNGDSLLDIVVANTYDDWSHRQTVFIVGPTYPGLEHNYLFLNNGGNAFTDASRASGLENVSNMSGPGLSGGAFTWALASADYDLDGDVDILFADNQGGGPSSPEENRGYLRLYNNDGNANFTEVTAAAGLNVVGGWMGLDFGDLNCDGNLDFFATDLGGYVAGANSRWFLSNGSGGFNDVNVGDIVATPFGWGTSILDYDNDGDSDVVYHGSVDLTSIIVMDNPGVLLRNSGQCTADFSWESGAFSENHQTRNVQGVAAGDFNNDGFEDIASVANFDIIPNLPIPFTNLTGFLGSPFDDVVLFNVIFSAFVTPGLHVYVANDQTLQRGSLALDINSADNGNNWLAVDTLGTAGLTSGGQVNRDGIGAVVSLTTAQKGLSAMRPIVGGSSYGSQDSLTANFGLGSEGHGDVEVLWPGGHRNVLKNVAAGERILFPEIPCDYATQDRDLDGYRQCVNQALDELVAAGVLNADSRQRFLASAFRCDATSTVQCLNNDRFRVDVSWVDYDGNSGPGRAVPVEADDSSLFYFFGRDNYEIIAKVLNGCEFNEHYWVFAGGTTDVEFTLTVTDLITGDEKTYHNPLGNAVDTITDTGAFATCP